ncbi:erythroid differentiation-related factor 1 [Chelonus insularis]|uniref:erythroid differentiation-related factor 1 n=1 Tax=Chelonus insularis TaxID=460826 RepID=UPI00158CA585|nr:erythroid differentiation-related factor 1 [Chelonus insularis]
MIDTSDGNSDDLKLTSVSLDTSTKLVKSTAVVKYSTFPNPATFAQLQCNTNLNLPPSNWLSSSAESYGLQNVWCHNTGFSSFRMAHMFPDCVGEVDVVSDAENIKKLLKMPYSQGVISMIVHRIENTLLLDDFDIHKYLLRQAESDWKWLKDFIYEHVFHNAEDREKRLYHKINSRNALQQKNLVSKFLYHSLVPAENQPLTKQEKPPLPLEVSEPKLPEPTNEEKLPDPGYDHNFARNVVWTFENIQMLIGTDMPIFGGKTHPCISLRLRDMKKPINVLTGIDYWLDNLMCNVPEVVMCYHLDGIVQKYELIKTEDLPNMDDAKFSPKVIRDVAQNILSFLKSNATKAGHTYWLFKGKNDDVVKLYDLTSLCGDVSDDKGQNPFTVPVAMLLYRVARNMKYSSDNRGHQGTIRMLLKNCIHLLAREKYPQIVTSAHFMLSDLYIPADTDPVSPVLVDQNEDDQNEDTQSECSTNQENESSEYSENDVEASATVKSLTLTYIKDESEQEVKYKPPVITGSILERCRTALSHVSHGLECLKYFPNDLDEQEQENESKNTDKSKTMDNSSSKHVEETQNSAKPFEAIPMPYYSLEKSKDQANLSSPNLKKKEKKKKKKEKTVKENVSKDIVDTSPKALICKSKVETLPTWQAPKRSDNLSWKAHLKILLYEKACLIFGVLSEYEFTHERFGASLRYIKNVLKCQKILEIFCGQPNEKLISYLLGRAGDICFRIVQHWNKIESHREAYESTDDIEEKILSEFSKAEDIDINVIELFPKILNNLEQTLIASFQLYEKALSLNPTENDKDNLLRRLGNIHNELGVFYMNQAMSKYSQYDLDNLSEPPEVSNLLKKSMKHLEDGIKAFEVVHDEVNLALLHSNTGRLMRLYAHMNAEKQSEEQMYYKKAVSSYQKALQVLGTKKTSPSTWDVVTWDLSTTLFSMATLVQEYSSSDKTDDEMEREVVEILQKALKYCDPEIAGSKKPVYEFRAAIIHHRLGSLYHRVYREMDADADPVKRKNSLQLSKLYYEKAANLLSTLEQPREYLSVQMEREALCEHQAWVSSNYNAKIKAYQSALEYMLQCESILKELIEKFKEIKQEKETREINKSTDNTNNITEENSSDKDNIDEEDKLNEDEEKLIQLLEQRLQNVLKSLTKLCLGKHNTANSKKEIENMTNVYKLCYSKTLRQDQKSGMDLLYHMYEVLKDISPRIRDIQEVN